ncbi:MAG TPA: alkaline phosphatase family protein [Acidimicrobiales bacterium]|jgi:phospholipase C|nr:alkaline phosphatase family protein [Acidimicrobiales bacterium]
MVTYDRSHALDHMVVVLFENRSLDNVLGHLYGPADGKNFDGVIGKELSNPIPQWGEHGAERRFVPYTIATNMDSPNPDSGEEYPHTNTQLYNILNEHNRFKVGEEIAAPWNAPEPGQTPTMDGFVTDYISMFTAEMGRQPTYEEYSQIMTGFTPEQVPVLNGLARGFGVFDHWFCEVPSQTFMNRSFWTAATSSGLTVNSPATKFLASNAAETIFNRLEEHGRTWKVYVAEPMRISFTGLIHHQRLKERLATHFVPFAQFEADAANGELPDLSFIEPSMAIGHNDYHPALGRSMGHDMELPADPPSSILGGEAFLSRIYDTYRAMQGPKGSNVWNTALLIGWDEPGGTYDHVPPGPVPPPDTSATAGEMGFRFDRSGYRVPAIVVSPWVEPGSVFNEEYRHTSLIATLREQWNLGDPFTARDASSRTFSTVFGRDTPREPDTWPIPEPRPVPAFAEDDLALGSVVSVMAKTLLEGIRDYAHQNDIELEGAPRDPNAEIAPEQVVTVLRSAAAALFPLLAERED